MNERDALLNLVRAWEALPGGRNYRPAEIAAWLHDEMSPAINAARAMLNTTKAREEV